MASQLETPIDLAEYLFRRLNQVGVQAVHGVPGDYNLTALDYVSQAGLTWVGNCNELNAGYAADGYARVKGIGAVVTAFGVGELSAFNAIAGAYVEMAPVVHIVGTPPTMAQQSGAILHHSMGDGNFRVFADMYKKVTVAQANLLDTNIAPALIDNALRECWLQSRPVYIELPTDMVKQPVEGARLKTPIDLSESPNDEGFEDAEVETILDKIYTSSKPVIVVDGFAIRFRVKQEINDLVRLTGLPTFTTPFGKGTVNETLPNFHGVYTGMMSSDEVRSYIQSSDMVLRMGPLDSDVNTGGFTAKYPKEATIDFHGHSVTFGQGEHYKNLHMKGLLRKILDRIDLSRVPKSTFAPSSPAPTSEIDPESAIVHAHFWPRLGSFFRSNDIIITETGTPAIGSRESKFPADVTHINSSIWLSIGYTLAASQGAALAARELEQEAVVEPVNRRTILFEGDGSFQMTAQELSTTIKLGLDLTIFLINNNGYTIERYIHGMTAAYNDIAPWRYTEAPRFFGANANPGSSKVEIWQVRNWGELEKLLDGRDFAEGKGKGLKFVEVFMGQEDAPESLKRLCEVVKRKNGGRQAQAAA